MRSRRRSPGEQLGQPVRFGVLGAVQQPYDRRVRLPADECLKVRPGHAGSSLAGPAGTADDLDVQALVDRLREHAGPDIAVSTDHVHLQASTSTPARFVLEAFHVQRRWATGTALCGRSVRRERAAARSTIAPAGSSVCTAWMKFVAERGTPAKLHPCCADR